jgi:hypothetical protein
VKVYAVHFRSKQTQNYTAHGYSLREGKYFFHKQPDRQDFDSFALEPEVVGIDFIGDEEDYQPVAIF